MDIKKILVPVDGSEHSLKAAKYALGLAGGWKSEVVILNCYAIPMVLEGYVTADFAESIRGAASELLEQYRALARKDGVRFRDMAIEGSPTEVIPLVAGEEKCDMIVMGSRGRSDLKGFLMGSVTHGVLQSAPCPTLVVR